MTIELHFIAAMLDPVMWFIALFGVCLCRKPVHMALVVAVMLLVSEGIASFTLYTYRFPHASVGQVLAYALMAIAARRLVIFLRELRLPGEVR